MFFELDGGCCIRDLQNHVMDMEVEHARPTLHFENLWTPAADSWAGVTEWADSGEPVGRCNSQAAAAAASSMGALT